MPEMPATPGAPPVQTQGQPPVGASPATQPVPNAGLQAQGVAEIGVILQLMERTLVKVGAGSEIGRDLLKSLNMLTKHVPPNAQSSGIQMQMLKDLAMKAREQQPAIAAMRPQPAAPQAPGGAPQAA